MLIDAKLYDGSGNALEFNTEIEDPGIKALNREYFLLKNFKLKMTEVTSDPNGIPEEIELSGWFIAVGKAQKNLNTNNLTMIHPSVDQSIPI